jgi:adenine-specific DNA-methyltransferase
MSKDQRPNQYYVLVDPKTGQKYEPNPNRVWAYIPESMQKKIEEGRIYFPDDAKKRPMLKRFQNELKVELNPVSTWAAEVSLNAEATREIQDSFGFLAFNYAKPVNLIEHLVKTSTSKDAIILDFFAGSGTTAQAILEQNLTDGGHRKFILVQLPEKISEGSEAKKSGYNTIADICKDRIRKVSKKIQQEQKQKKIGESEHTDLGFKVFKLSKSNCFVWDSEETKDPNTLVKHLEASAKGASTEDKEALAFELMLREGYSLDSDVQSVKQGKNSFLKASDGESTLWMCFDEEIDNQSVGSLPLAKDDKLIVLDSSLTDTQKVNLSRKFRIETV